MKARPSRVLKKCLAGDRHRDLRVLPCCHSSKGSDRMRGPDEQTSHMFSYIVPEQRVRQDHPLRAIRRLTDEVLAALSPRLDKMYSDLGRPSIPPEQLLRALLLRRSTRFAASGC